MANNSLSVCPHCGKTSKLIPVSGGPAASPSTWFESIAPAMSEPAGGGPPLVEKKSFWASDGITYAIAGAFAGGVVLAFSWYYELNGGALVAGATFLVGVGLHILKIVLHAPPRIETHTKPGQKVIKVEHWSDDNKHVLLDDLDTRIDLDELHRVAKAVMVDGANWSRPALTKAAGISQNKFHLLNSEFERLHYVHLAPGNKHILSPRAKAFLRKVVAG